MKNRKENQKTSKYRIAAIKDGQIIKIFDDVYQVKECGLYYEIIQQCLLNNLPEYKGYKWKYIRENEIIIW